MRPCPTHGVWVESEQTEMWGEERQLITRCAYLYATEATKLGAIGTEGSILQRLHADVALEQLRYPLEKEERRRGGGGNSD